VDATVNASFLQNDMKSKLSPVLDANIPIERDYVWWRILGIRTGNTAAPAVNVHRNVGLAASLVGNAKENLQSTVS
jgi:hypothetical protein